VCVARTSYGLTCQSCGSTRDPTLATTRYVKEVNTATGGRIGWHLDEEWRYFTGRTRFPAGIIDDAKLPPLDRREDDKSRALYVEASGGAVASCFKRALRKAKVGGEQFTVSADANKKKVKEAAKVLKVR